MALGGAVVAPRACAGDPAAPSVTSLAIEVAPRWAGVPLAFDVLTNASAAGQRVSVTRLDCLLSQLQLRRTNGSWFSTTNWFTYINGREGRIRSHVEGLPRGSYDRVRFCVGLPEAENHGDPAAWPAGHPLNPNCNGLHWSWQGGYVFMAIEGAYVNAGHEPAASRGYSWHVATDRLLMTVELPVTLELPSSGELQLALNADQIFAGRHRIALDDESATTHSRSDDALATRLRENIERAFTVQAVRAAVPLASEPAGVAPPGTRPLVASNATPYRLTYSRFFPQPALPLDNPLSEEGVALGRRLFHDPQLSINRQQSCASCHEAGRGLAESRRVSVGAEGQVGTRNAMPLFNLAWKSSFFWDGRAPSLRAQVLQPIENPIEMHEALSNVVAKLRAARDSANDYPAAFGRAFGTREISADRLARALECFLLVQVSSRSKFDRSLLGETELSAEEQRGFELFHTEYDPRRGLMGADCFHCHGGPLFQSQAFANNGLDREPSDTGRFGVTGKAGDRGKFAVPSLRNVAVTGPYMHDGRLATLEAVVEHYATGVQRSATLDANLAKHPDGGVPLSAADKRALVAFLRTLTDERSVPVSSATATGTAANAGAGSR